MTRASLTALALAATATAALAAPTAQADCCTSYGPELGQLIGAGDHAVLGYATLAADDAGGDPVRTGHLAQVSAANAVSKLDLPGAGATSAPGLGFAGGIA